MRAMRAEGFSGYKDLKLVGIPKPAVSDGRVLVKITAAGVTPLDHTILPGGHPRAKAPLVLGGEGAGLAQEEGGDAVSYRLMCDFYRAIAMAVSTNKAGSRLAEVSKSKWISRR
jgi:NADPH2:quinone reductase